MHYKIYFVSLEPDFVTLTIISEHNTTIFIIIYFIYQSIRIVFENSWLFNFLYFKHNFN